MNRTLITGGLGFLGAALTRALVERGDAVRVLDNSSRGSAEKLGALAQHTEMVAGDIRDPSVVRRAVSGCDRVLHLAFVNGTEYFYRYPAFVLDVGVKGMVNVLDSCIRENVPELIVASSSEVYQTPPSVPTAEDAPLSVPDPLNARYSYGGGKIISELMAINYGRQYFKRVVIFRPHNVYGPAMGYEHVIPQFVERLGSLAAQHPDGVIPFPLQGSGEQTRSFIFIDDFIRGLLLVIDGGDHLGIYHIGTKEEVRIADVANMVAAELGRQIEIRPGPEAAGGTPRRCPVIAKLQALGFQQKIPLAAGLKPTVQWYRDHPSPPSRTLPEPSLYFPT